MRRTLQTRTKLIEYQHVARAVSWDHEYARDCRYGEATLFAQVTAARRTALKRFIATFSGFTERVCESGIPSN
jgi:hypothetical protein